MTIYLTRNGETFGPFDLVDVRQMLATGAVQRSELGWVEGETEWKPISELLPAPKKPELSRMSGWGKRLVGVIFLLLGIVSVWTLLKAEPHPYLAIGWLSSAYCIAGGAWWAAGKGEPQPIPLRARLALIFALFLVIFSVLLFSGLKALPEDLARNPEAQKFSFYVTTGIVVLLGIPTILFGHSGKQAIAWSARFRGNGRCVVSLLLGYISCLLLVISIYGYLSARPESPSEPVAAEEPALVEPVKEAAPPPVPREFYLKSRFTVRIEGGVKGFPAGTPIRILADQGNQVLVEADGFQFEVHRDQILASYEP